MRGWLKDFLVQRFTLHGASCNDARMAYVRAKCAVRAAQGGTYKLKNQRGKTQTWGAVVPARSRLRRRGGGKKPKCPIMGEELWSWFVERLRSCPGRIGTQLLIDAATMIASDVYEDWRIRQSEGHGDRLRPPALPAITRQWVQRWRKAYGVTFRTVNLRYKISHSKRMLRLRIFWSNVLRLRLLHECLYGRDRVDLVSVDQKPLYFNSSLACKTLAPRGARKVNVKESVADSRERFTIMTSCPSWRVTRAPGLAILFRHSGAEASRVTRSVSARKHSLVQWAPEGSYRLPHVLDDLSWAIRQEHAVPDRPGTGAWPAAEKTQARARGEAADPLEASR